VKERRPGREYPNAEPILQREEFVMSEPDAAYVLIGAAPYRCQVLPWSGPRGRFLSLMLLEDVGNYEGIAAEEVTAFLGAGTVLTAGWYGDTHPGTGEPCYRIADLGEATAPVG
jgi:hypothetical protein